MEEGEAAVWKLPALKANQSVPTLNTCICYPNEAAVVFVSIPTANLSNHIVRLLLPCRSVFFCVNRWFAMLQGMDMVSTKCGCYMSMSR